MDQFSRRVLLRSLPAIPPQSPGRPGFHQQATTCCPATRRESRLRCFGRGRPEKRTWRGRRLVQSTCVAFVVRRVVIAVAAVRPLVGWSLLSSGCMTTASDWQRSRWLLSISEGSGRRSAERTLRGEALRVGLAATEIPQPGQWRTGGAGFAPRLSYGCRKWWIRREIGRCFFQIWIDFRRRSG